MSRPWNCFTRWSVVLVLATLLVGLGGSAFANNLLIWLFGVLIASFVLSAGLAWLSLRRITVKRLELTHGQVGQPLVVRYEVHNRGFWLAAFNLWVDERKVNEKDGWQLRMTGAPAWILNARAGQACHGEAVYWPTRRGPASFEQIEVVTSFPFGLLRFRRRFKQFQRCLIHPEVKVLEERVLQALAPTGLVGSGFSQRVGAGEDYYGLREVGVFQPLRQIAWKVSARRDYLVGIERSIATHPRVHVVLDLRIPTQDLEVEGRDIALGRQREEEAISLVASLLALAQKHRVDAGLRILGLPAMDVGLRHGTWHRLRLTAALALLDLDQEREQTYLPPGDFERAALVVVQPDRVRPLSGRADAWYYTAAQFPLLVESSEDTRHGEEAA